MPEGVDVIGVVDAMTAGTVGPVETVEFTREGEGTPVVKVIDELIVVVGVITVAFICAEGDITVPGAELEFEDVGYGMPLHEETVTLEGLPDDVSG